MADVSRVRLWLQVLRILQIIFLSLTFILHMMAFVATCVVVANLGRANLKFSEKMHGAFVFVMVVMLISVLIDATAVGLCISWCVCTARPEKRARARCCGSPSLCTSYCCDITWDSIFASLYAAAFLITAIDGLVPSSLCNFAMMVLFIATAVLSSNMGKHESTSAREAAMGIMMPEAEVWQKSMNAARGEYTPLTAGDTANFALSKDGEV